MKHFFTLHIDLLGFTASMLCAVHCMAVPILLTVSTWGWLEILDDPSIEMSVVVTSACLATISIVPSYLRHHRNLKAMALVISGFALIAIGRLVTGEIPEILFTSIGAAVVGS
ncbi:MAG TPA: MerC domain-containing protein, partial [Cyclobacteriaceae bacterium]|nr:MerC domain-containing protein [Cyclobacteriaceae bacterium]